MSRVGQTNHTGLPGAQAHRHQTEHMTAHCVGPGELFRLSSALQNQLRLPRTLFMEEDAPSQSPKLTWSRQHSWLSCLLSSRWTPLMEKFPTLQPERKPG